MNNYTDFYDLVLDGKRRVIEFTISAAKWRDLKKELAFTKDDCKKLAIIKAQSDNVKIHTPVL